MLFPKPAGAFFGALFAYVTAYYLGRRKSLWVFAGIFELGAGIMLAAKNGNLGPIYAGRVLAGFGVGGKFLLPASSCPPWLTSQVRP